MKTLRVFLLTATFLLSCFQNSYANTSKHRVTFTKNDIVFEKNGKYDMIKMNNTIASDEIGYPQLPLRAISILIPQNAVIKGIRVLSASQEKLDGNYLIYPSQSPLLPGQTGSFTNPNSSIYGSNSPYPLKSAEISNDGWMSGYRIVDVILYPLQYQPKEGQLIFNKEIEFVVDYEISDKGPFSAERRYEKSHVLIRKAIEQLVYNTNDINLLAPKVKIEKFDGNQYEKYLPLDVPTSQGSGVDYLIITNDNMKSVFQSFADWKTKKGTPAKVVTVSEIKSTTPNGVDDAETIRLYIRKAYEKWGVNWVLLGGDVSVIPSRYVKVGFNNETTVCDMYYSDLDGNWNANGNNVWGERYYDFVDLYPDVYVGRAPVQTTSEAQVFVNKTLSAEKGFGYHQNKILYLGENIFVPGDGKDYCDYVDRFVSSVYYYKTKLYEIDGNQNRQSVLNSMNQGYNIIFNEGHGDALRLSQGPVGQMIYQNDMSSLTNNNNFSIFYSVTCNANDISYDDCFSERFMLNPTGGGVGYIGSSWSDYPTHSILQNDEFVRLIFQQNTFKLGEAFANSKSIINRVSNSVVYRSVNLSYLLLGDPELEIYTAEPNNLSVQKPTSVLVGDNNFTITVTSPINPQKNKVEKTEVINDPVGNALVCLYKDGEVYAQGTTNSNGQATFSVTPNTTGNISIVVTKHNYKPYEGLITVNSNNYPFAYNSSYQIDDNPANGWNGNNDSIINPGEQFNLIMNITNGSRRSLINAPIKVSLSSGSTYITFNNSVYYIEDAIEPDAAVQAYFDISIDPSCPDQEDIQINISIENGEYLWSDETTITVKASSLKHVLNYIESDIQKIPGSSYYATLSVHNAGSGKARGVNGILTLLSGSATISDNNHSFGTFASNEIKQGNFMFSTSSPLSNLRFRLTLTDYYGKTWYHDFDVVAPSTPTGLTFVPQNNSIRLSWTANAEGDMGGYNIYRSTTQNGAYNKINYLRTDKISYYEDLNLSPQSVFYYKVSAVDTSGNESYQSSYLKAWTHGPSLVSGWPIATGEIITSHAKIVDVDNNGDKEIFIGSNDGKLYAFHHNGQELFDIDGNPSTLSGFANIGKQIWSAPAIGDVNLDGILEVFVSPRQSGKQPIYAWKIKDNNLDGKPDSLAGWPTGDSTTTALLGSPVLGNVDTDPQLEIIAMDENGYVYVWEHTGVKKTGWPKLAGIDSSIGALYATVAVGNMDSDSQDEIVVCGGKRSTGQGSIYVFDGNGTVKSGWPKHMSGPFSASPALADLNEDGQLEIIAVSERDTVYVYRRNGTQLSGWTNGKYADVIDIVTPSPAIGDIDNDGHLEVVIATVNGIMAWNHDGTTVTGFPYQGINRPSSPVLADVDGNNDIEIIVGSFDRKIYAIKSNGTLTQGWPVSIDPLVNTAIAVGDVDQNGYNELIFGGYDFKVYQFQTTGSATKIEWGSFHNDLANTGRSQYVFEPMKYAKGNDDNNDLPLTYDLFPNYPNPFNPSTTIHYQLPKESKVVIKIYNTLGQEVKTLMNATQTAGKHSVQWDGTNDRGEQVSSGIYMYRLSTESFTKTLKLMLLK